MRRSLAVFPLLLIAGCGQPDESAAPAIGTPATSAAPTVPAVPQVPVPAIAAAKPPAAFAQCQVCHKIEPGKHGIGPSLARIYGTKAGDVAGYAFSPAMKASGLTWDDATLDRFLTQPMSAVPGTKMVYPGVKDAAKRAEIIAFLKSL